MLKHLWKWLSILGLSACGEAVVDPFGKDLQDSSEATYHETIAAAESYEPTRLALVATVDVAPYFSTQHAQLVQQNNDLQATLIHAQNAGIQASPTPAPIEATLPATNPAYQNVTTATGVYDADGCAIDQQDTFYITGANDPTKIYFTTLANNVTAGTVYNTRWHAGAEFRHESVTWTADQHYDQICLYFWLESGYTPYKGGYWLVELMENGFFVTGTRFAMCEPGIFC